MGTGSRLRLALRHGSPQELPAPRDASLHAAATEENPKSQEREPQEAEDVEDEGLGHDDPRGMAAQVFVVEAIVELDDARRCKQEPEPVG